MRQQSPSETRPVHASPDTVYGHHTTHTSMTGSAPSWGEVFEAARDEARRLQTLQQFEGALSSFKQAVGAATRADDDVKAAILRERSDCYTAYSKHLQAIPSEASERNARFALDPQQLAKLALADADRACGLQPEDASMHVTRGRALEVLEEYTDAESAFFAALSRQPGHAAAQACAEAVRHKTAGKRRKVARSVDDLDCTLCCKLLCRPVTAPCGHTFCQACFQRCMDHSNKCPVCRRVLHTGSELPVTVVLQNLLEQCFPEETAARLAEERASAAHESAGRDLPLFVMAPVLPGESMALNIFEPRYRLMVRRCMQGDRRMGMTCAVVDSEGQHDIPEVVTQCSITESHVQPDGRISIECSGEARVQYTSVWEQDGYRMCRVQGVMQDTEEELSDADKASFEALDSKLVSLLAGVEEALSKASSSFRASVAAFLSDLGDKPDWRLHPERFTFWAARWLPLSALDKIKPLMMTKASERCVWVLDRIGGTSSRDVLGRAMHDGCCVM